MFAAAAVLVNSRKPIKVEIIYFERSSPLVPASIYLSRGKSPREGFEEALQAEGAKRLWFELGPARKKSTQRSESFFGGESASKRSDNGYPLPSIFTQKVGND